MHLKITVPWFLHRTVQPSPLSHSRTFSTDQKETLRPSPWPWQPSVCFLSWWVCLLWTLDINGIMCTWSFAPGLRIMLSRSIHVVRKIGTSFFYGQIIFCFVYLLVSWHSVCVCVCRGYILKKAGMHIHVQVFLCIRVFNSLGIYLEVELLASVNIDLVTFWVNWLFLYFL